MIKTAQYCESQRLLKDIIKEMSRAPRCYIRTFGCQQNVSDSERIAGMLEQCGYEMIDSPEKADLIVFNTCAVREHAEDRVFGNVGEIKRLKETNRDLIVALGGCMVQQQHIADKLRASYPFVDVIFNTNELQNLPGHLVRHHETGKAIVAIERGDYSIYEGLPVSRDSEHRAFIPIMYGCNNFCSYCVVPLVRGRERSRNSCDILKEFKQVIADGYKDIMLLGQNVNSYGLGLEEDIDFSRLLELLCAVEGDYTLRFMTSHPKDATPKLIDTIARNPKISRHLHLPVQSGSDRILTQMNRKYTSGEYLKLIEYAKSVVPEMTFSSDIIVGFPGETQQDFEDTLRLVETVRYRSLFTFIYSKREGTPAASMNDNATHKEKTERMAQLIALQDKITKTQDEAMVGNTVRVLVTQKLSDGNFEARMDDNSVAIIEGDCTPNTFVMCTITSTYKKRFYGKVI